MVQGKGNVFVTGTLTRDKTEKQNLFLPFSWSPECDWTSKLVSTSTFFCLKNMQLFISSCQKWISIPYCRIFLLLIHTYVAIFHVQILISFIWVLLCFFFAVLTALEGRNWMKLIKFIFGGTLGGGTYCLCLGRTGLTMTGLSDNHFWILKLH